MHRVGLALTSAVAVLTACDDATETTSTASTTSASGTGGMTTSTSGAGMTTGSVTTSSGSSSSGMGGAPPIPQLKLTPVAGVYDNPVFVTSPPADDTRLFVAEQKGAVRLVKNGALLPTPFVTVPTGGNGNEQGLIGLAFHPQYAANGRFFVQYSLASNDSVIAEYQRSAGNPDVANPAATKILLQIPQGNENGHNGGMLAFAPDGKLFIGKGDGSTPATAQNIGLQLGKILRVDVDTHPTPPLGNLPGGDPYVWDYGLRNPWRFSFDRANGDLYIGDVGETEWEEIDVEPAGQGHRNYGWSVMEGNHCFLSASCDMTNKTPPALEYAHLDGCSVTGGYVYRGSNIPGLTGYYLYGDYCLGWIRGFRWVNGAVTEPVDLTSDLVTGAPPQISSFGEDASGELYVVDRASGVVSRIDPE